MENNRLGVLPDLQPPFGAERAAEMPPFIFKDVYLEGSDNEYKEAITDIVFGGLGWISLAGKKATMICILINRSNYTDLSMYSLYYTTNRAYMSTRQEEDRAEGGSTHWCRHLLATTIDAIRSQGEDEGAQIWQGPSSRTQEEHNQ